MSRPSKFLCSAGPCWHKKTCRNDEATTFPNLGVATLQGLVDNAAALLACEKGARHLSAGRKKFHLKELLGYMAALQDKLERSEDTVPAGVMPMRVLKQRAERRRARIWATGLELFNEAGDILLLPQLFAKARRLFWASLACLVGSVFLRLFNALRLWKRVKKGKVLKFVVGVLVNLVEPNSGMEIIKTTLEDREDGSQEWDAKQNRMVTSDKDPVAVMSHVDYDAGKTEANNILVMLFGEDIPESVISVIYAIELSMVESFELDVVFALSAAGTILHLAFQLSEYWLLHQNLPVLQRIAQGRDKPFEQDATDADACEFAAKYRDAVVFVSLHQCSSITDAAVLALAEHCASIQNIDLTNCSSITDAAVLALAVHCAGIQIISLNGCRNITDAAVLALAEHCAGIQTIYLTNCSSITDAAVLALAEHCAGIQTIYLDGCSKIPDAAVLALAQHCAGIQTIGRDSYSSITDDAVLALA
jgi:hypothetical protein